MNISRYISEIELCDWYINDAYGTTTLYFTAPLHSLTVAIGERMKLEYPEAEDMTISLEFPTGHSEACDTTVCYSPTIYDPEEEAYTDCDWRDVDMPYEDVEKLFEVAKPMSVVWKK